MSDPIAEAGADLSAPSSPRTANWWGDFRMAVGGKRLWQIGPLQLALLRDTADWRVAVRRTANPLLDTTRVAEPMDGGRLDDMAVERFSFRQADDVVTLRPRLADRPVVIRPDGPLSIPQGQDVTLFVTTPVWVEICVDQPPMHLTEVTAYPPSDTWFGPLTQGGELCYAGRTLAKRHYEDTIVRPHRAVTPVEIHNRGADMLRIERLKLPMPHLALFVAPDGRLVSEAVQLTRLGPHDAQVVKRRADTRASDPQAGLQPLAPPRLIEAPTGALTLLTRWFA